MAITAPHAVVGTTVALSFILLGNAITQSFMGVPALLVDFPAPRTSPTEHAARARLLGRQWPVFWQVGNLFFRPISTFGILGYGFAAWAAKNPHSSANTTSSGRLGDWRLYGLAAACHLATVVHSAVNMQPLNEKLDALSGGGGSSAVDVDPDEAEGIARRWIKLNTVRLVMPLVAGSAALWATLQTL